MSTDVTFNEADSRYEVTVDGELAGFADVRVTQERIEFTHTEVFEQFQGTGAASTLAGEALRHAAAQDAAIVPWCPFIARYASRHDVPGARIEYPES